MPAGRSVQDSSGHRPDDVGDCFVADQAHNISTISRKQVYSVISLICFARQSSDLPNQTPSQPSSSMAFPLAPTFRKPHGSTQKTRNDLALPLRSSRAAKPETIRTQLHVLLDRGRLPADPVSAFQAARQMANNIEVRIAGSAALANNLAARLRRRAGRRAVRQGAVPVPRCPGVVLAALVTAEVAGAGRPRRKREQALLRIRGATLFETLTIRPWKLPSSGLAGAAAGLLVAFIALRLMGVSVAAPTALGWGVAAGRNLRKLLVVGAHAVLFHRKPHTDPLRMRRRS